MTSQSAKKSPEADLQTAKAGALPLSIRIQGKNINAVSYLATDYLNHFGEIIMLIEMATMMPDFLEEALNWQPKSYARHFHESGLSDPDVYVEAYDNAPHAYRAPFDDVTRTMRDLALEAVIAIQDCGEDSGIAEHRAAEAVSVLRDLSDQAAAIVNGNIDVSSQDAVDVIMND